jgi:hypothetical protein
MHLASSRPWWYALPIHLRHCCRHRQEHPRSIPTYVRLVATDELY